MSDQVVLILLASGANSSIRELLLDYGAALEEAGVPTVNVDLQPSAGELQHAVDLMRTGQVAFAITWLGIAQDLEVRMANQASAANAFETLNVPLVKLQGDLPAYFPQRHLDRPRNCANLYQAAEFVEFREKFLVDATAPTGLIPPMPMTPADLGSLDVAQRLSGKLVFLKNGNSPEALREMWRARLPKPAASIVQAMADEIIPAGLQPGYLSIGDFVRRFLESSGIATPVPRDPVLFFSAQLDDYLRRVKSTMIAESLLDFPVVIQGSHWEHVDFTGRRALHRGGEDADRSQKNLSHWLGVIDMSANVDTWPHDRVQRAAGTFSLALTNRQSWLGAHFPEFGDLTYSFEPESLKDRVSQVIANPRQYLDRAIAFATSFQAKFPRSRFAEATQQIAAIASLNGNRQRPRLQEFYVWPDQR